jgi:hypothetical protein
VRTVAGNINHGLLVGFNEFRQLRRRLAMNS